MEHKILDSSGEWYLNTSDYRMPDPESGAIFEPGIPTKAQPTVWLTGQKHITPIADPREPAAPLAAPDEEIKKVRGGR